MARGEPTGDPTTAGAARAGTSRSLAALLCAASLVTLAGCSGSGDGNGGSGEPGVTASSGTASAPPPGKYQTLPEACGSVSRATLRALLAASPNYAGDATLTYDTDRRVGCKWSGTAQGANRELVIDFERVVSYDPEVSDETRAQQVFAGKAAAAHIPDHAPDPNDTAFAVTGPSGAPATGSAGDTSPRRVGGIGDEAYLDDSVVTEGDGAQRQVTILFRTANVLVTVDFSQVSADKTTPPGSFELQLGAHGLAQELAKKISG